MMEFKVKLKNIQTLLFTQRAARLILRAAWLGAAGYLVGWGIYRWFGIFPEHKWWLAIGVGFAVFPIAGIFRPLYLDKLVWRLDRWMVLREQITTAFRISSGPGTQNDVEKALVADA